MQVHYGLLWNPELKEVIDPISEDQARKQWETGGDPFEIVLGDPADPTATINANSPSQGFLVNFLDELGRKELSYGVEHRDDGPMFVHSVTTWTWDTPDQRDPSEASQIETVDYRDDGYARKTVDRAGDANYHVTEYRDVPLDINWEPVPEFGDWASLARRNRDKAPDHRSNRIG
jgi:hypothetical protein